MGGNCRCKENESRWEMGDLPSSLGVLCMVAMFVVMLRVLCRGNVGAELRFCGVR